MQPCPLHCKDFKGHSRIRTGLVSSPLWFLNYEIVSLEPGGLEVG